MSAKPTTIDEYLHDVSPDKRAASIKRGRHLRYKSETPLNNLFLALLDRVR